MSNQPPYLPTALGVSKTTLLLSNNPSNGPYAWQLPQCSISSNPYSGGGNTGATGTYGLFNCIAIQNGAISAVVWFYLPPGGEGAMLGFSNALYPNGATAFTPWLYVGTNSYLYAGDWNGGHWQVSTPISPGWHMAVIEEWATSTSGPYYIALYLDGNYIGQGSSSNLPQLFGYVSNYPYNTIGGGYGYTWPNIPSHWFFFNGTIAYVALYNRVLTTSDVLAIYQGVRITSGLVAEYAGNNYNPSTGVWIDSSGNNYNITTTVVAGQYPPRGCILWPADTLSTWPNSTWLTWPQC